MKPNYEQSAIIVLNNNPVSPEELGELVYLATKQPSTFSVEEAQEVATARRRLLELTGGYKLYLAKLDELNKFRMRS